MYKLTIKKSYEKIDFIFKDFETLTIFAETAIRSAAEEITVEIKFESGEAANEGI